MKILFLDIDSVMIVWDWHIAEPDRNKFDMLPFNQECVLALNEIINKTNCEIVLSSDHRHNYDSETLKEIFYFNGCIKAPISITPVSRRFSSMDLDNLRADEILLWLKNSNSLINEKIEKWVAVDDLDLDINIFKEVMKKHFIQTLSGIHLVKDKIIKLLNN